MINNDNSKNLQQAVQEARAQQQTLLIEGSGSKAFYGNTPAATENSRVLSTGEHQGIINYEPKELVITARSGTPLHELQAVLAEQHQMLAFEPPLFSSGSQQALGDQQATLGGTIASGFSGPDALIRRQLVILYSAHALLMVKLRFCTLAVKS